MKTFEQLASEGFAAFEKVRMEQLAKPVAAYNAARNFEEISPEEKARWLAVAKQIVAAYAVVH